MKNQIKSKEIYRYVFAVAVIIAGIILSYFNIGKEFLGFNSVGSWLIYIGFIMIAVITLQLFMNKKRVVDERMMFVATKASRITFLGLIIVAFIIMIIDGIKTITIPYSIFMSYLICFLMIIYFISYKILLRKY
jgi:uncharacterized membrane protein